MKNRQKRFLCIVLSLLLALAPVCSYAALQYYSELREMSDEDLLALRTELEAEIERRGLASSVAKTAKASEPTVWVPKSGSKYHSRESCSNMKNPSQVTLSEAKACGFTACKKCNPPR